MGSPIKTHNFISKNFILIVILFLGIFSTLNFISAAAINDTLHINVQTTNSSGDIETGTYVFAFNLTESAGPTCSSPVYSHSVSRTTDNRGVVSVNLPTVGSGGGNLSALNFDVQYYLCYYRDGSLEDVIQVGRSPYSFVSNQINLSQITIDSNLDFGENYNITGVDYGFFDSLGSFTNRITNFFGQYLNISGNAEIGSNLTVGTDSLFVDSDSDFVGVGTTNPSQSLDVSGGIQLGNTAVSEAGAIRWTGTEFQAYNGTTWNSFGSSGGGSVWSTNGTSTYYNTGNVGIGTGNPGSALDIRGAIRATDWSNISITESQISDLGSYITWANAVNGTLFLTSQWNATNTSYYLASNPFGFYNSTDFDINNYLNSTYTLGNITAANTSLYDWVVSQGYIASVGTLYDQSLNTTDEVNFSKVSSKDWTNVTITESQISDLGSYITWANAVNGTLAVNSSIASYINAQDVYYNTTLYDWITSQGYVDSVTNIFNQNLNTTSNVTFFNVSTTGNVSAGQYFIGDGSYLTGLTESQIVDLQNYLLWSDVLNGTLAVNSSIASYINAQDVYYNTTLYDWVVAQGYIASVGTLYDQSLNTTDNVTFNSLRTNWIYSDDWTNISITESQISDLGSYITWANAVNGTLALNSSLADYSKWSELGNGTLFLTSQWNATNTSYYLASNPFGFYNSTTLPATDGANPFDQSLNTTDNVTFNSLRTNWIYSDDWTNISITESQISDLQNYYLASNPFGFYNSTDFVITDYLPTTEVLGNITAANTSLYNWVVAQGYIASVGTLYDQSLNTTDNVTFFNVSATGNVSVSGDFAVNNSNFFVDSSTGRVGIGTDTPTVAAILDINGGVNIAASNYLRFGGNGVLFSDGSNTQVIGSGGYLSFGNGSSEHGRFDTSTGLFGVNTTNPQQLLNVRGDVNLTGNVTTQTDFCIEGGACLSTTASSSGISWAEATNGTLARTDAANTFGAFNQTFDTDTFFIASNTDRVGVGTTTPSRTLDVSGTGIYSSSGFYIADGFAYGFETTPGAGSDTFLAGSSASNYLQFNTGGSERARFTTTGLGIGTTNPQDTLNVIGTANFTGNVTTQTDFCIEGGACLSTVSGGGGGGNPFDQSLNTTDNVTFFNVSATNINVSSNITVSANIIANSFQDISNPGVHYLDPGNPTISGQFSGYLLTAGYRSTGGSAGTPAFNFGNNGGDTDTGIFSPGANLIGISTGGTERIRINSSGHIGINVTTPQQLLNVRGTANFTGNVTTQTDFCIEGGACLSTAGGSGISWAEATNGTLARTDAANTFGAFNQSFNSDVLFVDSTNGNVGVGTNSPDEIFHIDAGAAEESLLISNTGANSLNLVLQTENTGEPRIVLDNGDNSWILFEDPSDDGLKIFNEATNNDFLEFSSSGATNLYTNFTVNNSNFHVDTVTGRVGIGLLNPVRALHVAGVGYFSSAVYTADGSEFGFETTAGAGSDTYLSGSASSDYLAFTTGGSEIGRITTTGLGLFTSDPQNELDVDGSLNATQNSFFGQNVTVEECITFGSGGRICSG